MRMNNDDIIRDKNGNIEWLCDGEYPIEDKPFTAEDVMEIKRIYKFLGKELSHDEERKLWEAIEH